MQVLFFPDPTQEKVAGYKCHSPIHDYFVEKSIEYKAAFNIRMSELIGLYAPNKTTREQNTYDRSLKLLKRILCFISSITIEQNQKL
ncbi:MAG: hypothetical protein ACJATK_003118 [Paracoccaceae bacterium]|jgi:hypothetical protein